MPAKTLGELAEYVGGRLFGDPSVVIKSASTLGKACEGDISFLVNRKYQKQLKTTNASAVIVGKEIPEGPVPLLIVEDPYYAFMQIMVLLHGHRKHKKVGISPRASISDSAKIGVDCHIYDFVVVADEAIIGDGCVIYPSVFIGQGVQIGNDSIIYPNVTVYDGCKIGNRVIINSNSTIGEDGFGYASYKGIHHKIPQIGGVTIEDDVEIGACCGIERGTLGDTIIGQGSKLGDLVTIGHGTKIGSHCLLVAQVGIAGSATLGHHCVVGGQAGVVGHVTIGNNVTIAAQAGVVNNVPDGQAVLGAPAIEANQGKRAYSMIQYLPEMRQNIRNLHNQIEKMGPSLEPDSETPSEHDIEP
ncbi:MAG: UDP-3-O-(3-hydroxymyristoyl)glucosamine N-acyltransferase [Planctomycetes bacterium RBG_13_46_10]|nr:MAG: UDP-3-O-(3-hydroxymyristoyl)glucosamine N-acyltransferase [Planctomycetes bacterium RBG_13_46_10]